MVQLDNIAATTTFVNSPLVNIIVSSFDKMIEQRLKRTGGTKPRMNSAAKILTILLSVP